jgi:hypothetical protein
VGPHPRHPRRGLRDRQLIRAKNSRPDIPHTLKHRRLILAIDTDKLQEFLGRFVTDLGATFAAGNVVIGHHLGLYRTLAAGPARAAELAERTGANPRYTAEWLRGQAAGGYVEYDPATDTYSMTEEQAFALGAQAGEAAIRQVTAEAGFARFRRAAETPFNLVYEVRP